MWSTRRSEKALPASGSDEQQDHARHDPPGRDVERDRAGRDDEVEDDDGDARDRRRDERHDDRLGDEAGEDRAPIGPRSP